MGDFRYSKWFFMAGKGGLAAFYTKCELEEREALLERQRIDSIVAERLRALQAVVGRRQRLREKCLLLQGEERMTALQAKDVSRVLSLTSYERRLGREVEKLDRSVLSKEKELRTAQERLFLADEALVKAQIERKRVEKLLSNREKEAKVMGAAVEQAMNEELVSFLKSSR